MHLPAPLYLALHSHPLTLYSHPPLSSRSPSFPIFPHPLLSFIG